MGYLAIGPCWSCRRPFEFNPELVPSVPIDPETGQPPDVDPRPGGYERAVRQPLCRECVDLINRQRRQRGGPEMEILPGAYEALE
ncbi:MAG: hypothetical protein J2P57_11640 [Acidimicrobiaceae bacterium]|nr:hypothetical protein [Acidimicrobiaceae bacterium]